MYCVKLQKKTEDVYIGLYCLSQTKWLRIDILDPNLPYISTNGGRAERAGDRNASAWAGGAHMSVMMSTTSTLYLFQVTCHELCTHGEGSSFLRSSAAETPPSFNSEMRRRRPIQRRQSPLTSEALKGYACPLPLLASPLKPLPTIRLLLFTNQLDRQLGVSQFNVKVRFQHGTAHRTDCLLQVSFMARPTLVFKLFELVVSDADLQGTCFFLFSSSARRVTPKRRPQERREKGGQPLPGTAEHKERDYGKTGERVPGWLFSSAFNLYTFMCSQVLFL